MTEIIATKRPAGKIIHPSKIITVYCKPLWFAKLLHITKEVIIREYGDITEPLPPMSKKYIRAKYDLAK